MQRDRIIEYLEANSIPEPNTGCWLWLGNVDRKGYGRIAVKWIAEYLAHRAALAWRIGEIGGVLACHRCDQPGCVNPDHIYPGTPADNTSDMVRKGRARGGKPILTPEVVSFLRLNVVAGSASDGIYAWGRRLGVSGQTISEAVNGQTWRHVK